MLSTGLELQDFRKTWVHRPWSRRNGARVEMRRTAVSRALFTVLAITADAVTITLSSIVVGLVYHQAYLGVNGMFEIFAGLGLSVSVLFVTINLLAQAYDVATYLNCGANSRRAVLVWTATFFTMLVFFFLTKASAEFSRVSIVTFFLTGLVLLALGRAAAVYHVRQAASPRCTRSSLARRIACATSSPEPWTVGILVAAVLRGDGSLREDLALAVASARVLRPDDIFILLPWSCTEAIDACVEAFTQVDPARLAARARPFRQGARVAYRQHREPASGALAAQLDRTGAEACLDAVAPSDRSGDQARQPRPLFLQRRYIFNQESSTS